MSVGLLFQVQESICEVLEWIGDPDRPSKLSFAVDITDDK